jgi:hypothetical protein
MRVPGSVAASPSHDLHKKRRESMAVFFSKRNVVTLEPVIGDKVEQLCQVISSHVTTKTPVNLSDVFFAFTNE